jgi:predicted acetyltransferase
MLYMIRPFKEQDRDQCLRILREVGWMEGKDTDKDVFNRFISDTTSFVTELAGEAEVLVLTSAGQVLHQNNDLPMSVVTGVLTSRVARMHGHALRTTAHAIAQSAIDGAAVSFLGIFDQGYYDKLGFGNLNYQRNSTIDPANLKVPKLTRAPKRLSKDDAEAIHNCRLHRKRLHGGCNIDGVGVTGCELIWTENGFGLGFENEAGELTHFLWLVAKDEHGPYRCDCYCWQTPEQLVELFSVLKSLSDQVHGVRMSEPPGFQLQDFLDRPFASIRARHKGDHAINTTCNAWAQCRILDVKTCIESMELRGNPVVFQLELTDPIQAHLPETCEWKSTAGSYIVHLGESSTVSIGRDESLPVVSCSVNDLSRLWIGSASAESLTTVGTLRASPELITHIDGVVNLPSPTIDWDF